MPLTWCAKAHHTFANCRPADKGWKVKQRFACMVLCTADDLLWWCRLAGYVYGKDDIINLPRTTFANTVKYITDELDAAATLLPTDYTNSLDFGRITKGACMALKSRVLLYCCQSFVQWWCHHSWCRPCAVGELSTANTSYWRRRRQMQPMPWSTATSMHCMLTAPPLPAGYGFTNVFRSSFICLHSGWIYFWLLPPLPTGIWRLLQSAYKGGANTVWPQDLVDTFPMKRTAATF